MMKVNIVQTAMADYRDNFVDMLLEENKFEISIYTGKYYFNKTTKTSSNILSKKNVFLVKNIYLFRRSMLFQLLPFIELFKCEILIIELNPRILSNIPLILIRKILGKKTLMWGHVWSRSGPLSRNEILRSNYRKISDGLILYTEQQKKELLSKENFKDKIYVAPNSIYRYSQMSTDKVEPKDLIYVGRLVPEKKIDLLLKAIGQYKAYFDNIDNFKLQIVGSGTQEYTDYLFNILNKEGINGMVNFHGHISDVNRLREIYSRAFFSISPGYVGLSLTQSLSFSTPMIISKNEHHSPEIELFDEGKNGIYFKTDNIEDLYRSIKGLYENYDKWVEKSEVLAKECQLNYSVESMVNGFLKACRNNYETR